jgi:hypothetical protein
MEEFDLRIEELEDIDLPATLSDTYCCTCSCCSSVVECG